MLDRRITFGGDVIDAWIANAPYRERAARS